MKTKLLVMSFFVLSIVLVLSGSASAQTTPTVQSFSVTSASFNPGAYPNAYDVSYSLSNASFGSGVTVSVDCHTGLTVQRMNDGGGLTSFTCGDIGAGGANGYFAYGSETLALIFTNSTSQSITEAISLSAYGMNTVYRYVTIPPAPIPQVILFNVAPSVSNPRGYQNAYDVSYALSNTSPSSNVTVTVGCYQGLTVQTINDAGGLSSFVCGDIGAGGANGYFAYGGETRSLVFTNTNSQNISVSITLSAAGMNSVTKSVTVTVMPSTAPTLILAASPDTITAGQSATIAWYTTNAAYCNAPDLIPNTTTWNVISYQTVYNLNSTHTYTMTCVGVGGGGSVTKSITITVLPSTQSSQFFGFSFPTSGATLAGGSTYKITWFNDNAGPEGYTAYLGTGAASNGSNLETIIRTIGTVNSNVQNEFNWTVPSDLSSRSDYRIEFRGKGGAGGVTSAFSITAAMSTPPPEPQPNPAPLPADIDTQNPQGTCLDLQNNLRYRMRDTGANDDILSLQDFLQANGYLHTEPTGFFGVLTLQAAKNFQQANSISPTGFVGPITRVKIKEISCR